MSVLRIKCLLAMIKCWPTLRIGASPTLRCPHDFSPRLYMCILRVKERWHEVCSYRTGPIITTTLFVCVHIDFFLLSYQVLEEEHACPYFENVYRNGVYSVLKLRNAEQDEEKFSDPSTTVGCTTYYAHCQSTDPKCETHLFDWLVFLEI